MELELLRRPPLAALEGSTNPKRIVALRQLVEREENGRNEVRIHLPVIHFEVARS